MYISDMIRICIYDHVLHDFQCVLIFHHSRKAQTVYHSPGLHPTTRPPHHTLESAISMAQKTTFFLGGKASQKKGKTTQKKTFFFTQGSRCQILFAWCNGTARCFHKLWAFSACEAKPVNPCSLKLSKGISAPFCKLDVDTSRQTFLGYNMHCWHTNDQTGPKKGAKPHQKGAKTVKKVHIGISALTCFCDTGLLCHFRLHNGQNTDLNSSKFSKPSLLTCRHIQRVIYLIDMRQLNKFQWLDVQLFF